MSDITRELSAVEYLCSDEHAANEDKGKTVLKGRMGLKGTLVGIALSKDNEDIAKLAEKPENATAELAIDEGKKSDVQRKREMKGASLAAFLRGKLVKVEVVVEATEPTTPAETPTPENHATTPTPETPVEPETQEVNASARRSRQNNRLNGVTA